MSGDYKYDVKEKDNEVEVDVQVSTEMYKTTKENAYKLLSASVEVPGFRPGKAPREMIEKKIGAKLLQKTLELILDKVELEIIEKEDLKPITRPEVDLKDFSEEKGVSFSFKFVSYPEVKLGDFEKIKVEKKPAKVKKSDIDQVVHNLFEQKYKEEHTKQSEKKSSKKSDSKDKSEKIDASIKNVNEWVTDSHVKDANLGDIVTTKALREKIKEQLESVKERETEEEYRESIINEAVKLSEFKVPKQLVESDVQRMEESYKKRISELKVDIDDFLAAQNTSIEKLREDWGKDSEKRIGVELVLSELAKQHELIPSIEEIEKEIEKEIENIEDENTKKELSTSSGRRYVASILIQRKGVEKLVEIVEGEKK